MPPPGRANGQANGHANGTAAAATTSPSQPEPSPRTTADGAAADAPAPSASASSAASRSLFAARCWYLWTYSAQALLLPFMNLFFLEQGLSQRQVGSLMALRPWTSAIAGAFLVFLFCLGTPRPRRAPLDSMREAGQAVSKKLYER
jgi:hypothetical protein